MSRPINPTQDIKMSKNSQTSTHAVLGTIFLQKCYASVAWAQPFFFVYMPRVSLCLYGTLHCSSKKTPPRDWLHVCGATQPPKCRFSMYVLQKKRELHDILLKSVNAQYMFCWDVRQWFYRPLWLQCYQAWADPLLSWRFQSRRNRRVDVANELCSYSR